MVLSAKDSLKIIDRLLELLHEKEMQLRTVEMMLGATDEALKLVAQELKDAQQRLENKE